VLKIGTKRRALSKKHMRQKIHSHVRELGTIVNNRSIKQVKNKKKLTFFTFLFLNFKFFYNVLLICYMISDVNILTFLYFLFLIFFLCVHISIIFRLILKNIFFDILMINLEDTRLPKVVNKKNLLNGGKL